MSSIEIVDKNMQTKTLVDYQFYVSEYLSYLAKRKVPLSITKYYGIRND